jgi:hypothetical protein
MTMMTLSTTATAITLPTAAMGATLSTAPTHGDGAVHRPWRQRFASKPPPAVAFIGRFGFEALGCFAACFSRPPP